jgi:hypothetical protein
MVVRWLDDASAELGLLPPGEKAPILKVAEMLEAAGDMLGYPHSSAARGKGSTLRELRPRQGQVPCASAVPAHRGRVRDRRGCQEP